MPSSEQIDLILAEIEAEHRAWAELLALVTADTVSMKLYGEWSAIDTLIHVTVWQENALRIARLQAAPDAPALDPSQGSAGVLGIDVERFNQELLGSHRLWTVEQALTWSNEVAAELRAALATLPAERLLGGRGPHGAQLWYGRAAIVHSREHRHGLERRLSISE